MSDSDTRTLDKMHTLKKKIVNPWVKFTFDFYILFFSHIITFHILLCIIFMQEYIRKRVEISFYIYSTFTIQYFFLSYTFQVHLHSTWPQNQKAAVVWV